MKRRRLSPALAGAAHLGPLRPARSQPDAACRNLLRGLPQCVLRRRSSRLAPCSPSSARRRQNLTSTTAGPARAMERLAATAPSLSVSRPDLIVALGPQRCWRPIWPGPADPNRLRLQVADPMRSALSRASQSGRQFHGRVFAGFQQPVSGKWHGAAQGGSCPAFST